MADPIAAQAPSEEIWRTWPRLVARAWTDAEFKRELLRSPATVLGQSGVTLGPSTRVRVVELAPDEVILPLPPRPAEEGSGDEPERPAGDEAAARLLGRFQPFMSPWSGGKMPDSEVSKAKGSDHPAAKR